MSAEPRKAYEVERVSRCVVRILVYADSAWEARRDAVDRGEVYDEEYFPKGVARVRRAPERDR